MARFPASVRVDDTATVADNATLGVASRPLQGGRTLSARKTTTIGPGCAIGDGAFVGEGAEIGANTIVDGGVRIGSNVTIGKDVLLLYGCTVDQGATIGDDSVVGRGFVGERSVLGRGCRVFGSLIHAQRNPLLPWDDPEAEEDSPVLKDGAYVGWEATVIGPVVLGERAYVCAGAIITRSVPSRHVAFDRNRVVPYEDWPGDLAKSPFFR
jgi:bifunctional UDP-N-acetylglucosamine pyrophosphorylase/glucosamine-1-phosphate N-acetyltransferase